MSFDNTWYVEREDLVFSKLKAKMTAKLKTKYSNLDITRDGKQLKEPKFPNVLIQFITVREVGGDLENLTLNAIDVTIQADVTVSKTQGIAVANEVSAEVVSALKSMGFDATMPSVEFDDNGNYRTVSRFRRIIGHGDTF